MSNKIISFIKSRAAIVTVLFGLFGAVLQKLILSISDKTLGDFGFAFALLFSFLTCMTFSFLLRGDYKNRRSKRFKKFKQQLNILVVVFLVASVTIGLIYFSQVNKHTISYRAFDNEVHFLKGEYNPLIDIAHLQDSIKKANNIIFVSDDTLIRELGGTAESLYSPESLSQIRFRLLTYYCIFIICFTALAYIVPDIVTAYYSDQTDATVETEDKVT